jgi:hypothetical protein
MLLWRWIISWLVWFSADPAVVNLEHARAAAAVSVAHASMLKDSRPAPTPTPKSCDCGETCVKGLWKPDGRITQKCECRCRRCVAEREKGAAADCPTGACPKNPPTGKR